MDCPLPATKRIVTSNVPLSTSSAKTEPAVSIAVEEIVPIPLLENKAARGLVYTHMTLPTSNNEAFTNPQDSAEARIVQHHGANIQFNYLAPGARVPMHRTTTTDYMIVLEGEIVLITPVEDYDPKTGLRGVQETIIKAGDITVQRGTMHAWENRTDQWVRTFGTALRSAPNFVADNLGTGLQHLLMDHFDV